jgi:hypothetical protein
MRTKKNNSRKFTCYFCKKSINASSKTEILYRNSWIDGCCDCFVLSITKATAAEFQQKEY